MKPAFVTTVVLAVALVAPALALAQAGILPTSVSVDVASSLPSLSWDATTVIPVRVAYCHTAAGAVAPRATHVDVSVTDAPDWVETGLSPETLFMDFATPPSGVESCSPPQAVSVLVSVRSDAPANASGEITVTAVAGENAPNAASQGGASFPVQVVADEGEPNGNDTAPAPERDDDAGEASLTRTDATAETPSAGVLPLVAVLAGVAVTRARRSK